MMAQCRVAHAALIMGYKGYNTMACRERERAVHFLPHLFVFSAAPNAARSVSKERVVVAQC